MALHNDKKVNCFIMPVDDDDDDDDDDNNFKYYL